VADLLNATSEEFAQVSQRCLRQSELFDWKTIAHRTLLEYERRASDSLHFVDRNVCAARGSDDTDRSGAVD
jgi:hypothetical protein